jgi:hypothetical protein
MRLRPSNADQREFSLLTGPRRHPINPIRRQPGVVRIGQRQFMASVPRIEAAPEQQEHNRKTFIRAWAKRQNHECAATMMGEFCGHLI